MKNARLVVLALVVLGVPAYGWWFADRNSVVITLDLLFTQVSEVSLWVIVWSSFGLGVGVSAVVSLWAFARLGATHMAQRRAAAKLEAELRRLRPEPS